MNKIIALIAITVAIYGKAQCCSSTYSGTYEALGSKQYNNTMECNSDNENCSSNNESCTSALQQFISDAESLNNNTKDVFLAPIINNAAFIFNKTKNLQSSNFDTIITKFTPICQRYTDVMAHKYYLQKILFDLTNASVIERLTLIISKLQTMAYNLKTAQMENDDKACVKFKPSEYIIIYHSRLQNELLTNSSKLDAICLLQMRARSWQVRR